MMTQFFYLKHKVLYKKRDNEMHSSLLNDSQNCSTKIRRKNEKKPTNGSGIFTSFVGDYGFTGFVLQSGWRVRQYVRGGRQQTKFIGNGCVDKN
jgi:hypothetical protein